MTVTTSNSTRLFLSTLCVLSTLALTWCTEAEAQACKGCIVYFTYDPGWPSGYRCEVIQAWEMNGYQECFCAADNSYCWCEGDCCWNGASTDEDYAEAVLFSGAPLAEEGIVVSSRILQDSRLALDPATIGQTPVSHVLFGDGFVFFNIRPEEVLVIPLIDKNTYMVRGCDGDPLFPVSRHGGSVTSRHVQAGG